MVLERGFLLLVGVVWTLLGAWCAVDPALLERLAGVGLDHWSAAVEVRAMYGGVQLAIGLFTLAAAAGSRPLAGYALAFNALVFGLLALVRALGLALDGPGLVGPGLASPGGLPPDNWNAMALWWVEVPLALVSGWLLHRRRRGP